MYRPMVPTAALRSRGTTELKTVDVTGLVKVLSTTATFTILNPVQEGTGFYNRIGRKITMKSLRLKAQIGITGNESNLFEYLRIMIVYDRQPTGSAPAIADILQDVSQAGVASTDSKSSLNLNNSDRWLVLADIPIEAPYADKDASNWLAQAVFDYKKNEVNIDRFINLRGLEAHFKSTSNPITEADITTGTLYLVTYGSTAAASAPYQLLASTRMRYFDK